MSTASVQIKKERLKSSGHATVNRDILESQKVRKLVEKKLLDTPKNKDLNDIRLILNDVAPVRPKMSALSKLILMTLDLVKIPTFIGLFLYACVIIKNTWYV